MHPLRRQLLVRLLIVLAMALAAVSWGAITMTNSVLSARPRPAKVDEVKPYIPAPADQQLLADATRMLTAEPEGPGLWSGDETQLLEVKQQVVAEARSSAQVSMIFLGGHKRFAVIGNRTYSVGQSLPDGRTITSINRTAIRLDFSGQKSVLNWSGPKTVHLARPEEKKKEKEKKTDGSSTKLEKLKSSDEQVAQEAQAKQDKLKLNAAQAKQLMEQLKNIPGVVGTSPDTPEQ